MSAMLEKEIESKLRKAVEQQGGRCLKWICPGWSGVPDRIVLLPGGRIVFVETKRPKGGKLSPMQKKWGKWLIDLDFDYWRIWDLDDLDLFRYIVLEEKKVMI